MNSSSDEALHSSIAALINELYQEAEIEFPSLRRRITPLGDLVGSLNLASKELPGLSQQVAMRYLIQQGVLLENPEAAARDELAGFLYANTSYGCIFLEANDHLTRRRFSVAHELGHYLLHFRPLLKVAEGDQMYLELMETFYRDKKDDPQETASGRVERVGQQLLEGLLPSEARMEYEANQFATALLMPEAVVRGLFARVMLRFSEEDLVTYLATEMLVSNEAMRWRLRNFHLLPLPEHKFERRGEVE
ncbi:MAG TPA: ImmA/IrrE family metallo-endopeptidase [Ktedonosporobacter sp.]|jgi:Zn-dependent peptidase ImmA (M78 family)|nr:ImmA/IrrE family metallo-endopeptidase [Ktedonosporobacter sp.]